MRPGRIYISPGLARPRSCWDYFLRKIDTENCFDVHVFEYPGNGGSNFRRTPLCYKEIVKQCRQHYLKVRQQGQVNIFYGNSFGAMIAMQWHQLYPEDFDYFVFTNTSFRSLNHFTQRLLPRNYLTYFTWFFKSRERIEDDILRMSINNRLLRKRLSQEEHIQEVKKIKFSVRNTLTQLSLARQSPQPIRPTVPTLLLSSLNDRVVSHHCSDRLSKHWGVDLRVHVSAGHNLEDEDPGWVLNQVKQFVGVCAR
ncbi:MAG: alpha/beta hydrolase [Gammaproteobacteria bacterium]|nr:alpha/beta hydrolase [Gammaproteobacteria bacterium]MDH5730239.1 alpha/beta hydrolase [Gammaproteobacteria bacterium]